MTINETATLGLLPNVAHEKPPNPPASMTEGNPRHKSSAVASLADARARRAALLLADEEIPDQEQEARAWNDRERAS